MNLLNPKISFKICLTVSVICGLLTIKYFSTSSQAAALSIIILCTIISGICLNYFFNFFKQSDKNLIRTTFMLIFVGSIFMGFLPYLFSFITNSSLLLATSITTGTWLLTLFFTKTN
jgi:hypothetical protein